jgi:glycosyltransferase involved in cell wall biosynthesis
VKILVTHPSAELYGADRMALLTVQSLVRKGHTVTVVVPADGPLVAKISDAGADIVVADVPVLRKSALSPLPALSLLWNVLTTRSHRARFLSSVDPDVVYLNTIVQPWWIVTAKLQRRQVVVHVREAEGQSSRLVRRLLYAPLLWADLIVCNSESTKREIISVLPRVQRGATVIYNGKDWSEYRVDRPECDSDPCGPTRLTVVGRLSERKGQDLAVIALAEIVSAGYNATLTLAGNVFPGNEWFETHLQTTARDLDIEDRVVFLGFQEDIRPVLRDTDIAIVPSRIEPFGTVAAECMAAGLLTIVADVDGLTEIVDDEKNGLTFRAGSQEALTQRCLWAMSNPDRSAVLASIGQRDVSEKFGLDRYEREIVKAVESVEVSKI